MRLEMGGSCCVAARDRTISNGSHSDAMQGNVRYSPSWSFRWDNRRRVAGEETSINWLSERVTRNERLAVKSQTSVETLYASEEGSPLESCRTLSWQKSPISEQSTETLKGPQPDPSTSRTSPDVKVLKDIPAGSDLFPIKMSPSMRSVSSLSASPLSYHGQFLPPNSTPSRWTRRSPAHHLLRQVSDSRTPEMKSPSFSISEEGSPFMLPGWSNESNRGSHGGSSDNWSIPAFTELMATSHRENWSFDSEPLGMSCDRMSRSRGRVCSSPPIDVQTCGICSKLLTEKSIWGTQKIIATNELSVVAILICGHVYHAECLENMTAEINKYDPACPVCTLGEKQTLKLSEKTLRAEMDLKARINKRLKKRMVDNDVNSDSGLFYRQKSSGHEIRGPKMSSSSSLKSSSGKPFLKRHFSFGSKRPKSLIENNFPRKRGFFWSKSARE